MGKRGRKPLEERIGEEKFKELLKRLDTKDIARLYCNHFVDENHKAKCKACARAIYRAKKRIEKKDRAKHSFEPIDIFHNIPEIENLIEFERDVKGKKTWRQTVRTLEEMWTWMKEDPQLCKLSRPVLWDERHIMLIMKKLKEYGPQNLYQAILRWILSNPDVTACAVGMILSSR